MISCNLPWVKREDSTCISFDISLKSTCNIKSGLCSDDNYITEFTRIPKCDCELNVIWGKKCPESLIKVWGGGIESWTRGHVLPL